jgi:L-malate glycosyltransferase
MKLENTLERSRHVLLMVDTLRGLDFADGAVTGLAGIEAVLLRVIRLIPKEQYRFSVISLAASQNLAAVDRFPCPLHVLPLKRTYDWNAFKMAFRLSQLIRFENVNIVHTFLESADIWGGLVAKMSGCPILISSRRDMGCFRSTKHMLGYRVVNKLVNQVQAVSETVRDFCIKNDGLAPQKVVTLHNGIELERIDAANGMAKLRDELRLEPNIPVITTIANIRPVKGLDVLARAAAVVCREFPQARFLIVGEVLDRQCANQLQTLVRSLHLGDNITFLGRSDQAIAILKTSNLFCLLSRSEGFSNAILEAMGCGLPCVVTAVGGNPEAIEDGRTGFLVPSENVDVAADRILKLLKNPDRAREMGALARKTVTEKFSAKVMVTRWAELYDELLGSRIS